MGQYDSWYLRAVHPVEPLGLWIRHTYHEDSEGGVRGARWFTLFTPDGVHAQKASFDHKPVVGADSFAGEAGDAQWKVRVEALAPPFAHLPARWMYRAPFPKTKPISVSPLARMSGEVTIGGRSITIEDWPGMVGHNWGAEHAHRWIWLHVAGFDGEPDAWLDVTLARLKLGGLVTPWLANGAIHVDGGRHRLGGSFRSPKVDESPESAKIALAGKGIRIQLTVNSPPGATVVWKYADPDGGEHFAANCSIAGLKLDLVQGRRSRKLLSSHKAAYELGMKDAPPNLRVEPFPDP